MVRAGWSVAPLLLLGAGIASWTGGAAEATPETRDEARVELGRRLFFDPAVSRHGKVACAACHDPEHGFSDPRRISLDEDGPTPRHSQPIVDLAEHEDAGFHWDGEFPRVRDLLIARLGRVEELQAAATRRLVGHARAALERPTGADQERLVDRIPQSLSATSAYGRSVTPTTAPRTAPPRARTPSPRSVASRLRDAALYAEGFRRAFGDGRIDTDRIATALEQYVLSLRSAESRFDRYLAGDDAAISTAEERGFELFAGPAGCNSCHTIGVPGKTRALTDGAFHNTGVAFRGRTGPTDTADGVALRSIDVGRRNVDFRIANTGKFKTPSLRDVSRRAPYMHDGTFATLEDVVRYYARGGTGNPHQDRRIRKLDLSERDVADLVAFMKTLDGAERPGLGELPADRPERVRVRVLDLEGRPLRRFAVRIRPSGDRLQGTRTMPTPFAHRTDQWGYLEFPFPASTHVALDATGFELGTGRLLPDWTEQATLRATPIDTVSVVVRRGPQLKRLPSQITLRRPGGPEVGALRRKRRLGTNAAIYSAKVTALDVGATPRMLAFRITQGPGHLGTFPLDTSGGASEPVELAGDAPNKDALRELQTHADTLGRLRNNLLRSVRSAAATR